jgi:hypothetical protein
MSQWARTARAKRVAAGLDATVMGVSGLMHRQGQAVDAAEGERDFTFPLLFAHAILEIRLAAREAIFITELLKDPLGRKTLLAVLPLIIEQPLVDDWRNEPRRVCRRLIDISYAAMGSVSRAA